MLRNLFWKEVRWGVGKRSGTYVRLWWIQKSCPMVGNVGEMGPE